MTALFTLFNSLAAFGLTLLGFALSLAGLSLDAGLVTPGMILTGLGLGVGCGALIRERMFLASMRRTCEAVAAGDFEKRIALLRECGAALRTGEAVNNLIDMADAYLRESMAMLQHAAEEKFYRIFILTGLRGSYRHGAEIMNTSLEKARTNTTTRMTKAANEVGALADTVSAAAVELRASSEQLVRSAQQTSGKSVTVAAATEEVTANIHSVSTATEQLGQAVLEVSRKAQETSALVQNAVSKVKASQDTMGSLSDASQQIGSVLDIIQDIAWQINLLSLNATIEAARAGEAGRSFAVVAAEVKNLSDQTAKAAVNISGKIKNMQTTTMQATAELNAVSEFILSINTATDSVASAVEEQTAATREISSNMEQASKATTEVADTITQVSRSSEEGNHTAGEVLKAADELSRRAVAMQDIVERFMAVARAA